MRHIATSGLLLLCVACSTVGSGRDPLAPDFPVVTSRPQGADARYGPGVGESILQAGGALTRTSYDAGGSSTDATTVNLLGGIGYFENEWLEIGGQVTGDWTIVDGPGDSTSVFLAPYANGNYKVNNRLWLYAGPHIGLGYFKTSGDDATDIQYGLQGGARYWLDPRTSLFGELRYTAANIKLGGVDVDIDTTQFLVGFSLVF